MSEENREELLTAIAKVRAWIEDLAQGRVVSFAEIANGQSVGVLKVSAFKRAFDDC